MESFNGRLIEDRELGKGDTKNGVNADLCFFVFVKKNIKRN